MQAEQCIINKSFLKESKHLSPFYLHIQDQETCIVSAKCLKSQWIHNGRWIHFCQSLLKTSQLTLALDFDPRKDKIYITQSGLFFLFTKSRLSQHLTHVGVGVYLVFQFGTERKKISSKPSSRVYSLPWAVIILISLQATAQTRLLVFTSTLRTRNIYF